MAVSLLTINKKIDPSKTTLLRRAFMREMVKRFRLIAKRIADLLVIQDVLALNIERQAWRFKTCNH